MVQISEIVSWKYHLYSRDLRNAMKYTSSREELEFYIGQFENFTIDGKFKCFIYTCEQYEEPLIDTRTAVSLYMSRHYALTSYLFMDSKTKHLYVEVKNLYLVENVVMKAIDINGVQYFTIPQNFIKCLENDSYVKIIYRRMHRMFGLSKMFNKLFR